MDKDSVLRSWYRLQQRARACWAPSASTSSLNFAGDPPKQINDYVYEVFNSLGRPSIELVFFHGLQLEGSKEAHLTTWLTQDGSELWLKWILDYYPQARILLISYDAFTRRTHEQGNLDMFRTCENLVQDLTRGEAQVGQAGCPVALVGHCIGGLVMKELCVALDSTVGKLQFYEPDNHAQNLFLNINGFFFYGCPHHGSRFADDSSEEGELLKEATTLNKVTERRNELFRKLRLERNWKTYGIGETLETKLGRFQGLVVPEASARADVDVYYTDRGADHFTVSRTKSKISSSFIKLLDFIGDILEADKKRHIPKNVSLTKAIGLEGRLKTLIKELDGAQRLAIVGMPGIGKSTLAKKLYNTPWKSFDYTCFLSDVKKFMGERDDPHYLQGEVLRNLYYKGKKAHPSCRWESLNGQKVLLVLDDVDRASQVPETIDSSFLDGSCVIVTSRASGFLIQEDFKCYVVKELGSQDSKGLFCHHAFGQEDAPELYKNHVAKIIAVLQGLPLGLVVAGGFLKRRVPLSFWDNVLKRLNLAKAPDGRKNDVLWSVMTMAYDELEEEEQQMFLDIATCFHGENLEDVIRVWIHCGWATTAELGLTNLTEKNLVTTEKTSGSLHIIRMHEVLRKLGQSKACREHDDVTTHSRVRYDASNPLPKSWPFREENLEVKVLMTSCGTRVKEEFRTVDMQQLCGLKELRVLQLDGVSLNGPCNLLPEKLAYMKLSYSEWTDQVDSRFPELSGEKPAGQLAKLKCMEVVDCQKLEGFLYCMGSLQGLEDLRIVSCVCLEAPQNALSQLKALQHFEITYHDWNALLDMLEELWALEKLVIRKCIGHGCPKTLEQILFLESLAIRGLLQSPGQVDLPHPGFHEVLILYSDSESIDAAHYAETSRSTHPEAVFLFIKDCTRLKALPDILERRLGFHVSLIVKDCSRFEDVEDALQQFQVLKRLDIEGCHNIRALHDGLGGLKFLHTLSVTACGNLESLTLTLVELPVLQQLTICSCPNLEILSDLGKLRSLERLTIGNCRSLQALPPLEQLGALRRLEIYSCESLLSLPAGLAELHWLEQLAIGDCKNLQALSPLEQLVGLRRLTIYSCEGWRSLLTDLAKLQRLEYLAIGDCDKLEALPGFLEKYWARPSSY